MAKYIECEAAKRAIMSQYLNRANKTKYADVIDAVPAADVVARDCFDKILAENDDMRAIIDTYGGIENIQSAFVKLHEIETADVVPVRHGRWVPDKEDVEWGNSLIHYRCSECKKRPHFDKEKYRFILSPFCPNCGAKMDGDIR